MYALHYTAKTYEIKLASLAQYCEMRIYEGFFKVILKRCVSIIFFFEKRSSQNI